MDEPLPIGMGLKVPEPLETPVASTCTSFVDFQQVVHPQVDPPEILNDLQPGSDKLVDFDELTLPQVFIIRMQFFPKKNSQLPYNFLQMRSCIATLINTLPSVMVMKKHLEQKVRAGNRKPKLQDVDPNVLPAAWSILRW